MAGFAIVTEQVAGQAVTLQALGGELDAAVPVLANAGQAAGGTEAAGACAGMAAAWIAALSEFARATDALAVAVGQAGECYALVDQAAVPHE